MLGQSVLSASNLCRFAGSVSRLVAPVRSSRIPASLGFLVCFSLAARCNTHKRAVERSILRRLVERFPSNTSFGISSLKRLSAVRPRALTPSRDTFKVIATMAVCANRHNFAEEESDGVVVARGRSDTPPLGVGKLFDLSGSSARDAPGSTPQRILAKSRSSRAVASRNVSTLMPAGISSPDFA